MPDTSFSYNGATIHVRERIGRDALWFNPLLNDIVLTLIKQRGLESFQGIRNTEAADIEWFVRVLQQSTVEGELGFDWPLWNDTEPEQWAAAYEALMNADYDLVMEWRQALRKADMEVPDPKERPAAKKSKTDS